MNKNFEELWEEVWVKTKLPIEAKKHLPQSLSENTKQTMQRSNKSLDEMAIIINNAVEKINNGSVKTLDLLIYEAFR